MRSEEELYSALIDLRRRLNNVIETFELVRAGIANGQALVEAWNDYLITEGKINLEIYGYAAKKGARFVEDNVDEDELWVEEEVLDSLEEERFFAKMR